MDALKYTILTLILMYLTGWIALGYGEQKGIVKGMQSRVSAASCQQYLIAYQERLQSKLPELCMDLFFDKPARGKR